MGDTHVIEWFETVCLPLFFFLSFSFSLFFILILVARCWSMYSSIFTWNYQLADMVGVVHVFPFVRVQSDAMPKYWCGALLFCIRNNLIRWRRRRRKKQRERNEKSKKEVKKNEPDWFVVVYGSLKPLFARRFMQILTTVLHVQAKPLKISSGAQSRRGRPVDRHSHRFCFPNFFPLWHFGVFYVILAEAKTVWLWVSPAHRRIEPPKAPKTPRPQYIHKWCVMWLWMVWCTGWC